MDEAGDITSSTALLDDDGDGARHAQPVPSTPSKNDAPANGANNANVHQKFLQHPIKKTLLPPRSNTHHLHSATCVSIYLTPNHHQTVNRTATPTACHPLRTLPLGERSRNCASSSEPLPFSVNAFLSPLAGPRFSQSSSLDTAPEPT
ncbi:protogenin [Caerostris extrusa]|uniref:Protogenin n=1 Tax=Caerostris extrusa TaxID=172846 RepID=A0AAV4XYG7_CAEEX|nr:protogenin [Caerostris extrusa]